MKTILQTRPIEAAAIHPENWKEVPNSGPLVFADEVESNPELDQAILAMLDLVPQHDWHVAELLGKLNECRPDKAQHVHILIDILDLASPSNHCRIVDLFNRICKLIILEA